MGFVALVCDQMHGGTLLSEGFVGFFFFLFTWQTSPTDISAGKMKGLMQT